MLDCRDVQKQLTDYLYNELTFETCQEIRNHLDGCTDCQQTFESLQKTRQILNLQPEVSPPAELMRKLEARIDQEKIWREAPWRDYLYRKQAIFKMIVSAVCGMVAAIVSVLLIDRNLPANNLSPKAFLICGIIWGSAYVILFRMALNGFGEARRYSIKGSIRLDLSRIAVLVLIALAVATALTSLTLTLEAAGFSDFHGFFGNIFGEFHSKTTYFLLGGLCALISFLAGSLLLGSGFQIQPLAHGLIAGCLFTVAIAPGLAILCVPFTLGIYVSTMVGLSLGAMGGGVFGCWLMSRRQSSVVV